MANPLFAFMIRPLMQQQNKKKLLVQSSNGLYEKRFVNIGGIKQWITIRGQDRHNPFILFLHGGPASSYIPFAPLLTEWEKYFTIVQWDQRGAGKTFQKNGTNGSGSLSLNRLANDGIELVEFLCKQFEQKKIVLIGSSLGSLIGLLMIHKCPELFFAYVGAEQNSPDSRLVTYRLIKELASQEEDKKGMLFLDEMGADDSYWTQEQFETMNKLAIKYTTGVPNLIYDLMMPALLYSPDYSLRDIKDLQRGMESSMKQLFPELMTFKIDALGYKYTVPFFIFQGEKDILTPVATAKAYFARIVSPHKEFVLIKHAGHLAEFANSKQFLQELITRVKPFCTV